MHTALPMTVAAAFPRWPSAVAALALAACAHSPLAAVPGGADAARAGSAPEAASSEPAACRETPQARTALENIARELQAQGLVLRAACHAAGGQGGWMVQVRVVDGLKASRVVRGPLADGQDVDMGTPAGAALAGAQSGSQNFSPDVQHNREWLRLLMARHEFDNLPDAWWHFARRNAAPQPGSGGETDLAAR